ncbi:hypothetical protein [Aureliella helgolandensis]|uniref:Uncharacterized protein n=1 Tax=Aureliella helgolandensis TaxID=2527968 RepID=A0A518GE89_9BACT|nr:hypothetical protein [Aureliella helgolandensis]QDV26912.1 hypothetical protein Q31a_52920 [Aureliella helgolandensis]
MTAVQETAVADAGKCFWRLQAAVMVRESAEWLTTAELLKLAESCEATAHEERMHDWNRQFAIPMIRELGNQLARARRDEMHGAHSRIVTVARALRKLQRKTRGKRVPNFRTQIAALERELDELLDNCGQATMFDDSI